MGKGIEIYRVGRFCIVRFLFITFIQSSLFADSYLSKFNYAVVISQTAYQDKGWRAVADALLKKYSTTPNEAKLIQWKSSITEVKSALAEFQPDYIGFICQPTSDATEANIRLIHQMTRELDNDPYGDAVWGIITGYEAGDALRAIHDSVTIKTAVGGHYIKNSGKPEEPYRPYYQAIGTFEAFQEASYPGDHVAYSFSNGTVKTMRNDPAHINNDRITTFTSWFNSDSIIIEQNNQPSLRGTFDFFTTSGHGNLGSWQAHYPRVAPEGYLMSDHGQLYGKPYNGSNIAINSKSPKVYFATGNCLIGNPDKIDNMVYAWFHTGRAVNMFGYMVESWFGYMGWGTLDRFVDFPGLNNPAESFFITNQSLLFDKNNKNAEFDQSGLAYDKDGTAIYGDPKTASYMYSFGDSGRQYMQTLTWNNSAGHQADTFTYVITAKSFDLEGGPGFYRGRRPFYFLPTRIDPTTTKILENSGHEAVITDNFVLWDALKKGESKLTKGKSMSLRWTARVLGDTSRTTSRTSRTVPAKPLYNVTIHTQAVSAGLIQLQFNHSPAMRLNLELYNASGRVVFYRKINVDRTQSSSTNVEVKATALSQLGSGLYCLRLADDRGTSISKKTFVLMR